MISDIKAIIMIYSTCNNYFIYIVTIDSRKRFYDVRRIVYFNVYFII